MALTQTDRTKLFTNLVALMGQQDAENLIEQLPPTGWDGMATKDNLAVALAEYKAAHAETRAEVTAGFAAAAAANAKTNAAITETNAAITETNAAMVAGFAKANAAMVAGFAKANAAMVAGFAEANAAMVAGFAEANAAMVAGFAAAAERRAEMVRREAWHLYVTVMTVVLASVSIWIALLIGPVGG